MHYLSTRNNKLKKSFIDILFQGLSKEGGLYLPEVWPIIPIDSLRGKNYQEVAHAIIRPYVKESISEDELSLILKNTYIAKIDGVLNAVVVDGLPIGNSVLQGEGAGPGPTTSALISDLCSVLKGEINYPFGVSSLLRKKIPKFNILNHSCSSYLRIEVKDQPGVLSSITKIFANNRISIKNLIQKPVSYTHLTLPTKA